MAKMYFGYAVPSFSKKGDSFLEAAAVGEFNLEELGSMDLDYYREWIKKPSSLEDSELLESIKPTKIHILFLVNQTDPRKKFTQRLVGHHHPIFPVDIFNTLEEAWKPLKDISHLIIREVFL